jgi:hypothetical protein
VTAVRPWADDVAEQIAQDEARQSAAADYNQHIHAHIHVHGGYWPLEPPMAMLVSRAERAWIDHIRERYQR